MDSSTDPRFRQGLRGGRLFPVAFILVGVLLSSLPLIVEHCFRVPLTPSAPPGLYLLDERPLHRGAWVVVCLPEEIALYGRRRGYLAAGRCPGRASEVLKQVGALSGDRVEVQEEGLVINGRPVPRTARRRTDSQGRRLARVPEGVYQVGPDQVWLLSVHSSLSWDSRYYGPVPLSGVRSSARLLLATPGDAD